MRLFDLGEEFTCSTTCTVLSVYKKKFDCKCLLKMSFVYFIYTERYPLQYFLWLYLRIENYALMFVLLKIENLTLNITLPEFTVFGYCSIIPVSLFECDKLIMYSVSFVSFKSSQYDFKINITLMHWIIVSLICFVR